MLCRQKVLGTVNAALTWTLGKSRNISLLVGFSKSWTALFASFRLSVCPHQNAAEEDTTRRLSTCVVWKASAWSSLWTHMVHFSPFRSFVLFAFTCQCVVYCFTSPSQGLHFPWKRDFRAQGWEHVMLQLRQWMNVCNWAELGQHAGLGFMTQLHINTQTYQN